MCSVICSPVHLEMGGHYVVPLIMLWVFTPLQMVRCYGFATLSETSVQLVIITSTKNRKRLTRRWRQGLAHLIFSDIAPAQYRL